MGCKNVGSGDFRGPPPPSPFEAGPPIFPMGWMPTPAQVMDSANRVKREQQHMQAPTGGGYTPAESSEEQHSSSMGSPAATLMPPHTMGVPPPSTPFASAAEEGINSLMIAAYAMTEFGQGSASAKKPGPPKSKAVATPSLEEDAPTKKLKLSEEEDTTGKTSMSLDEVTTMDV
jgi:hypothetical protein